MAESIVRYFSMQQRSNRFVASFHDYIGVYNLDGAELKRIPVRAELCIDLIANDLGAFVDSRKPNSLIIYSFAENTVNGKIKSSSPILGAKVTSEFIFLAQLNKVKAYSLKNLSATYKIASTAPNPRAAFAVSGAATANAVVVPDQAPHKLLICHVSGTGNVTDKQLSYGLKDVGALAISENGKFTVAVIDSQGKYIELIDGLNNHRIGTLHGLNALCSSSALVFHPSGNYLAAVSYAGALQVYQVPQIELGHSKSNSSGGSCAGLDINIFLCGMANTDPALDAFAYSTKPDAAHCPFFTTDGKYVGTVGKNGVLFQFAFTKGEVCIPIVKMDIMSQRNLRL